MSFIPDMTVRYVWRSNSDLEGQRIKTKSTLALPPIVTPGICRWDYPTYLLEKWHTCSPRARSSSTPFHDIFQPPIWLVPSGVCWKCYLSGCSSIQPGHCPYHYTETSRTSFLICFPGSSPNSDVRGGIFWVLRLGNEGRKFPAIPHGQIVALDWGEIFFRISLVDSLVEGCRMMSWIQYFQPFRWV